MQRSLHRNIPTTLKKILTPHLLPPPLHPQLRQIHLHLLLPLYHHPDPSSSFHRATTASELSAILEKPQLQNPQNVQLVELVLDKMDTSWKLGTALAWRSEEHKEYLTREGFVDTYGGWGLDGKAGGSVKWS